MDFKNINWEKDYNLFLDYLYSIKDIKYKEFNSKIITTNYEILGIRIPILKKISKEIFKGDYKSFLNIPNKYYEIVMLKGFIIGCINNLQELDNYFNDFIKLIDNWAICDSFCASLKIVKTNREYFLTIIYKLVNLKSEYIIRVGLVLLLDYYVLKEYLEDIFNILNKINSDLYYVNMAKSWLICEVFTKYEKEALLFLENNNLDKFTINKAISKIRDSYKVSEKMKKYVLKFKK